MRISDWSSDVCSSDLGAGAVDRAPRREDRAGRLDGEPHHQVLAGGDAAEHAAGVVRQEHRAAAVDAHLVGGLVAGDVGRREAVADLHALDRVYAHHRTEETTTELPSLMRIPDVAFRLKKTKNPI